MLIDMALCEEFGFAPHPQFRGQDRDWSRLRSSTLDVKRQNWYVKLMILSYRDNRTRAFADGRFVREFHGFVRQAFRRLEVLDAAMNVNELKALRSNRLEVLKGDRAGQCSIRINSQWRICFEWPRGAAGPANVEIVDYH
jgi:proteic killer suppression protein